MNLDGNKRIRVAVDAMGGDFAPTETVQGAIAATLEHDVDVLLVGNPEIIYSVVPRDQLDESRISIIPSQAVINESEAPVQALRQKPNASIVIGTGLVKSGKADALVTMGSTGAAMAASAVILGLMKGIERPTLGGPILGLVPETILLDIGSNVDCRPGQLVDYAALGVAFARSYIGIPNPTVGLLTVGLEEGKGNKQARETFPALQKSGLNFVGNIEGYGLVSGSANVVVCDGFVGNILLKTLEGLGKSLGRHLLEIQVAGLAFEQKAKVIQEIHTVFNQGELVGGGPLFGVNGTVVVGHGSALAPAITNAIATAQKCVTSGLQEQMEIELNQLRERTST